MLTHASLLSRSQIQSGFRPVMKHPQAAQYGCSIILLSQWARIFRTRLTSERVHIAIMVGRNPSHPVPKRDVPRLVPEMN